MGKIFKASPDEKFTNVVNDLIRNVNVQLLIDDGLSKYIFGGEENE